MISYWCHPKKRWSFSKNPDSGNTAAGRSEKECSPSLLTSVSHCTRFPTSQHLPYHHYFPHNRLSTGHGHILFVRYSRIDATSRSIHIYKSFNNFSYVISFVRHQSYFHVKSCLICGCFCTRMWTRHLRVFDTPLLTAVRFDGYRTPRTLEALIPASLRRVSECSPKKKYLKLRSTIIHSSLDDYR